MIDYGNLSMEKLVTTLMSIFSWILENRECFYVVGLLLSVWFILDKFVKNSREMQEFKEKTDRTLVRIFNGVENVQSQLENFQELFDTLLNMEPETPAEPSRKRKHREEIYEDEEPSVEPSRKRKRCERTSPAKKLRRSTIECPPGLYAGMDDDDDDEKSTADSSEEDENRTDVHYYPKNTKSKSRK